MSEPPDESVATPVTPKNEIPRTATVHCSMFESVCLFVCLFIYFIDSENSDCTVHYLFVMS